MVQYAEITGVSLTRRWQGSCVAAAIEIDVCQDVLRSLWVTGVVVVRLQAVHRAALKCVIP